MSEVRIHQVGDNVYVHDVHYEWLPAIVFEVQEHIVVVQIVLPNEWNSTTILQHDQHDNTDVKKTTTNTTRPVVIDGEQRSEKLMEYDNHQLPLQNSTDRRGWDDMSQLQYIHEAEILYQIKARHTCRNDDDDIRQQKPYTRITTTLGNMIIVAVNPCRYIPSLYTEAQQLRYIKQIMKPSNDETNDINAPSFDEKKEGEDEVTSVAIGNNDNTTTTLQRTTSSGGRDSENEPHIYEISSLAYYGLISTMCNQTILVSGESGSGKTESIKIVLTHLASLTPTAASSGQQIRMHYSDDDLLVSHILASSPIFESFGNAKTLRNTNSSRFGKVTKLRYAMSIPVTSPSTSITSDGASRRACLIGSSFQAYLLESNRVVTHVEGERNYHIFYQILSAPSTVKNELLGPDWREATPSDFRYLNRCSCGIKDNMIDASNWTYTLKALIVFGWDGDALERLIRALGIILLIGNIEFRHVDDDQSNKASIVQSADLNMLSTSLGIDSAELELALTQRTIETTQDLLLVPLTPEEANEACEALSKTIYTRIFESIVTQINCLTSSPPTAAGTTTKTIALVDIFGFERFTVNRFDQFCINYANERLQQKYILDSLSRHKIEYETEGITLPEWKNIDNSRTVDLFGSIPGLIQSLNDQCILPNGSSVDFVSIVKQLHQRHERFIDDKLHPVTSFGVNHFAGPVLYDACKFVERNTDKLPAFLISVVATSTNGLIAQELGAVLKDRTTVGKSKKKSQRSTIDAFQIQLKELMSSIDDSYPRYIRCIKPCDDLEIPGKMDHHVVLRQLKCAGLVTAIAESRKIYPDKLSFERVATRYACLLSSKAMTSIEDMDTVDKAQFVLSSIYAPLIEQYHGSSFVMPFACGHTKVFFRAGALEILENQRKALRSRSATKVQCVVRSSIARRRTLRSLRGFTLLQATYRASVVLADFKKVRKCVVIVQTRGRIKINRNEFLMIKSSVISLQRWWIRTKVRIERRRNAQQVKQISSLIVKRWLYGYILKQRQQKENDCAFLITCWLQSRKQRAIFARSKFAATTIAAWFRAIAALKKMNDMKKAANIIVYHRKLQIMVRTTRLKKVEEIETSRALQQQTLAAQRLQLFIRSRYRERSERNSTLNAMQTSHEIRGTFVPDGLTADEINLPSSQLPVTPNLDAIDKGFVVTPRSQYEQVELYRRQIDDLKSDITLLTSEAELHKQEVEAEFEDRLAEYENEVLQLKQTIEILNNEKISDKDEIAANIENVQNLKTGIQSMHEAHREYLNKVMRAVENANREHQIALALVQREKEKQIKELSDAVERLQSARTDFYDRNADRCQVDDRIYQLARKIEKVTAPDYVAALAKKVRKVNLKEEYIEEKLSGRVRQFLYKLEDIAALSPSNSTCEEEYIVSLQQQLISAKSEIERLNECVGNYGSKDSSVGRRGLKKFFER